LLALDPLALGLGCLRLPLRLLAPRTRFLFRFKALRLLGSLALLLGSRPRFALRPFPFGFFSFDLLPFHTLTLRLGKRALRLLAVAVDVLPGDRVQQLGALRTRHVGVETGWILRDEEIPCFECSDPLG